MFRSTLGTMGQVPRALMRRFFTGGGTTRVLSKSWMIGSTGSVGGLLCWVGGCGVFAAAAAVAAVGLLSGIFFGAIQATFNATARSYAFEDRGPIQIVFSPPAQNQTSVVNLNGRLPGFHFVFVDIDDKGIVAAQGQEERLFETDATVSFDSNPPTITGTINEVGGGETFTIEELYPDRQFSASIGEPDEDGGRSVSFDFIGSGPEGDLNYSLVLQGARIVDGQLVGQVEVVREFTTSSGQGLTIASSAGELIEVMESTGTPPTSNDNGEEGQSDEDTDTTGEDVDESPTDIDEAMDELPEDEMPSDDPPADEMPEVEMPEDELPEDEIDMDDLLDDPQPISVSSCPGVIDQIASLVDTQLQNGNYAVFDVNADGVITAGEVKQNIDPLFELVAGPLTDEAASCIAQIANDAMNRN